jgi:hypothetical protein
MKTCVFCGLISTSGRGLIAVPYMLVRLIERIPDDETSWMCRSLVACSARSAKRDIR